MESAPNANRNIDSNRESNCNEKKLNEMRVHDSPDLREGEFDFDEAHAPLALLGLKTSGRIINGEKNSKENCESTNGIVKCDGNLLNYERKRKNSCDSGSDTLSEHSVKNTPPGHSGKNNTNCVSLSKNKVSQEMGSRYNENEDEILQKNIIKIAQNNLNASDSGEDDGSGCDNDNNKRKKNEKNNSSEKSKEISSLMHSSLSMNAIFKNDEHNHSRGESSFPLPSCQQGTQRSIRLQSIPPLPLFSPLQPDPSLLMQSKNEHSSSPVSATTSAEKRGASIVLDLVNRASKKSPRVISATNGQNSHFVHGLNDSHSPIMGSSSSSSGSGNGSNSSSNNGNGKEINHLNNSNHGNNNHNNNIINNNGSGNNAELLSISDEEMINFPKNFTDAFNIGDYEGVSKIIIRCIAEDCSLKTPALENDLIGRHHVISVMFALLDDHPDAIMMWKDTKYLPNECILKSKHYFSGTKALHSTHTHLYQKVSSTLVNQVDLTRYSSDEITQLVELEKSIIQKGSPFLLFAKGTLKLSINRANMISRFLWDWKVTSFREFVDSTKTVKR